MKSNYEGLGGPFQRLYISNLRASRTYIGIVLNVDNSGWRLISHLLIPSDNSVDLYIDPSEFTVHYASFDTVSQMLAKVGRGLTLGRWILNRH